MNDELEAIIARKDGRFTPTGQNPAVDSLLQEVRMSSQEHLSTLVSHWYIDDTRPAYFDIVIENKISGFCYTSPDEDTGFDFIGINASAITAIYDLYYRLFSDPYFLPELGIATNEVAGRNVVRSLRELVQQAPNFACKPINQTRLDLAEKYSQLTVKFLINHEFAHINNGHLAWLRENCQASHTQEMFEETDQLDLVACRRALEMDADSAAVMQLMLELQRDHSALKAEIFGAEAAQRVIANVRFSGRETHSTPMDCYQTVARVSYIFFRLNDPTPWGGINTNTHPHPAHRMFYCSTLLGAIAERKPEFGVPPLSIGEMLGQVTLQIEQAFARLLNKDINLDAIRSVIQDLPRAAAAIDELGRDWAAMRDSLTQKKRHARNLA